jgi:4-carboxymuconolactone decarboxylase
MTQYCWGALWGRPGLPRKTRSMLNLAMLVALNRPDEFKVHVRSALGNGVSREEIAEILLQTAVYAGVPAANAAFKDAREVFAEIDREAAGQKLSPAE